MPAKRSRHGSPASGTQSASRREFLTRTGASAGAGAAAFAGLPAFAAAPAAPAVLRFQGAWSARNIFHEYALDFARKVNEMTGGELRIEVLPAGAVAPASGLLDAVSKGVLDGAHCAVGHHHGRQSALALWGSGPAFGMDANMLLAWHKYGGGRELLEKLYKSVGANVVSFLYGPMPTQPLGWFRKAVAKAEDLKGLRVRTDAASGDVYAAFGAAPNVLSEAEILAAVKGGTLDGVELNNASSDRALGLPDLFEVCMLQSYHQNAEQLEVLFNRTKYDALPARVKAIIANAVEAASADMSWKAIDRYSRDYVEMRQRERLRFFKTPDAILQRQLTAYDAAADKQNRENPLYAEIAASQQRFAERAVRWDLDTNVHRDIAYRHYFSKPRPGKAPAKKA